VIHTKYKNKMIKTLIFSGIWNQSCLTKNPLIFLKWLSSNFKQSYVLCTYNKCKNLINTQKHDWKITQNTFFRSLDEGNVKWSLVLHFK